MKTPPPVSDLSALPLILTIREIAAVYRVSLSTVRRGVQNGTFRPRPWDKYPYRWRREDIEADIIVGRGELPHRAHGFAARATRRPAKAAIPPTSSTRRAR